MRIVVAEMSHETNTFSPVFTDSRDFRAVRRIGWRATLRSRPFAAPPPGSADSSRCAKRPVGEKGWGQVLNVGIKLASHHANFPDLAPARSFKRVTLTPENGPESPILEYDPAAKETWYHEAQYGSRTSR